MILNPLALPTLLDMTNNRCGFSRWPSIVARASAYVVNQCNAMFMRVGGPCNAMFTECGRWAAIYTVFSGIRFGLAGRGCFATFFFIHLWLPMRALKRAAVVEKIGAWDDDGCRKKGHHCACGHIGASPAPPLLYSSAAMPMPTYLKITSLLP